MDALSFPSQPSTFRSPTHEHSPFQYRDVLNNHSVSNLNVSPQAPQPRPHLQTYFPSSAPPAFKQPFTDSPYSSGSSSSFPNDSPPPAEPPADMEPDYTSIVSSPDDVRYSYPPFDQGDPSGWAIKGLPPLQYNAEFYVQQPTSAPATMHTSWPSDAKKPSPQQYHHHYPQRQQQQQQQQSLPASYPSFPSQVGRMRSLSDGTPPISNNSNANGMNCLYTPIYSGQSSDLDLVYPPDDDIRIMDSGLTSHSRSPFPPMQPYPQQQQQEQLRPIQSTRVKRELGGRSMSDAAAFPMRPSTYMSSSGPYNTFEMTMHTTSAQPPTFNSSGQGSQPHDGYATHSQGGNQHNVSSSVPMSMPVPIYGSLPAYNLSEQASDAQTGYSSGGIPDQGAQTSEEMSPVMRFRQLQIQSGQGGCDPRYVNDMGGPASRDGAIQDDYETNRTGIMKEVKKEEEGFITMQLGAQADDGIDSEFLDAEADEDADGEDDHDGDYRSVDEDDFDEDGDGEYVVHNRRSPSTNSRSLRPRRRSSSATRYQPYSFASNTSTSRPAPKPAHVPSSQPAVSRRKTTRVRTRPAVTLPVPVPVPNLTKKSRGRRVPTVDSLAAAAGKSGKNTSLREGDDGEAKNARTYTCDADGCGKCFARGEHLKRHVRSIHTYEKPHRCPFPGCDKDFSRHDNLRQHLRVHKGFHPRKEEHQGDNGEKW